MSNRIIVPRDSSSPNDAAQELVNNNDGPALRLRQLGTGNAIEVVDGTGTALWGVARDGAPLTGVNAANVKGYGAKGDGVTDDSAAIAAALAANANAYMPPGTYVVKTLISLPDGANLMGAGRGKTFIDFSGAASNFTCISAAGSLGTSVPLTADTTVGGTTLTVAAGGEAGINADDYLLVGSNAYYETRTGGGSTGQKMGEIVSVASTSSGSITLREALVGGFTDESSVAQQVYKVSDSAFFQKITFVKGISVSGITFIGTSGSGTGSTQCAVNVNLARDVTLTDVRAEHVGYCGFQLLDCVDFTVSRWSAFDCWNTNTGYGLAIGNACQDGHVMGGHARRMRHGITAIGSSNSSGHGVSRRISVDGFKSYDTTADGVKAHACTGHWSFTNTKAYGANGAAILWEGNDITIGSGCSAQRTTYGYWLANETLNPTRFQVAGGVVSRDPVNDGLRYAAPATTGAEPMVEYAQFDGFTSVNAGSVGFYMKGVSGHTLKSISVGNIVVQNAAATTASCLFEYCTTPTVGAVKVRRAPSNTIGIRFTQCTDPVLAGWAVEFTATGTTSGLYVVNTSGAVVTGGRCTNGAKGVNLDNTATNCTVVGNDLTGCTTPISPGTGSGHKVAHNRGDVLTQSAVTATTSPQTITNNGPRDFLFCVSGGTVTLVEVSNDQTNFSTVGTTTGTSVYVPSGGAARVTYSVAPTMRQIAIL